MTLYINIKKYVGKILYVFHNETKIETLTKA